MIGTLPSPGSPVGTPGRGPSTGIALSPSARNHSAMDSAAESWPSLHPLGGCSAADAVPHVCQQVQDDAYATGPRRNLRPKVSEFDE